MLLLPKYDFIEISKNKALMCIAFMMFTVLLVPNNLTLDLVGGEKYHKTLETLISSPIDIRSAFLGKILFIQLLSFVALVSITVIDNCLLIAFFQSSFISAGVSMKWIISMYIFIMAGILLLALIGSYVAFNITNLKTGGYIVSLLDIFLVYFLVNNIRDKNDQYAITTALLAYICVFIIAIASVCLMKKSKVMKHIK